MKELLLVLTLVSSSVFAGSVQNVIDKGEYTFMVAQNIEIERVETQMNCKTYNKLRFLGTPIGQADHSSQSVVLADIKIDSDEVLDNGLPVRILKVTLPDNITLNYDMPFNHELHTCDMYFKINISGQEKTISNGIHHEVNNTNVTSDFEKMLSTQFIYINKYSGQITKDFTSTRNLADRIK